MGTKMITTILVIDYNEKKKNFVKKNKKKVKMPKMVLKFATEQNIDFGHIVRCLEAPKRPWGPNIDDAIRKCFFRNQ